VRGAPSAPLVRDRSRVERVRREGEIVSDPWER
jgi:hypothetical protein